MYGLEVGHSVHEHLDAVDGEGVVQRGAQPAERLVALQRQQSGLPGLGQEPAGERVIGQEPSG